MELDLEVLPGEARMRPHQIRLRGRRRLVRLVLLRVTAEERCTGLARCAARRLPRHQPGHGMAVRGRARHATGQPRGVWRALPPIALGHASRCRPRSCAAALAASSFRPTSSLASRRAREARAYRLWRHRHPVSAECRSGFRDLMVWSFLMASAHGPGSWCSRL